MNRLIAISCGALVAAGLTFGAFAHEGEHKSSDEKEVTIQGELIDTACFVASDGDAKGEDHAECAQACMASGVPAGILPEGSKDPSHLMFLLTNPAPLAPHAAKTIKVEGVVHKNIHAIDARKIFVKDGEKWTEIPLKDEHHKSEESAHDKHGDHKHD